MRPVISSGIPPVSSWESLQAFFQIISRIFSGIPPMISLEIACTISLHSIPKIPAGTKLQMNTAGIPSGIPLEIHTDIPFAFLSHSVIPTGIAVESPSEFLCRDFEFCLEVLFLTQFHEIHSKTHLHGYLCEYLQGFFFQKFLRSFNTSAIPFHIAPEILKKNRKQFLNNSSRYRKFMKK